MSDINVETMGNTSAAPDAENTSGADFGASDVVIAKSKAPTYIRLATGETVVRRRGKQPLGSMLLDAEGNPVGEPVTSKAKGKKVTMLRLPDGSLRPRGKGRPPKGAVVVDDPVEA